MASHPDDVESLRSLMEIKISARKLVEAIGIIDRMIALEPEDADLQLLKAHLNSHNGEAGTAKMLYEELLEKDPLLVEAYHGLFMSASQSDDDDDIDDLLRRIEGAMELCKRDNRMEQLRDFKLLIAQINVIEGNYEDSLEIYQELVEEQPSDFRPYLGQGIVYTLLRKKDEAEKHFRKYRSLLPKDNPYANIFEDNVTAVKFFQQMDEKKGKTALKS